MTPLPSPNESSSTETSQKLSATTSTTNSDTPQSTLNIFSNNNSNEYNNKNHSENSKVETTNKRTIEEIVEKVTQQQQSQVDTKCVNKNDGKTENAVEHSSGKNGGAQRKSKSTKPPPLPVQEVQGRIKAVEEVFDKVVVEPERQCASDVSNATFTNMKGECSKENVIIKVEKNVECEQTSLTEEHSNADRGSTSAENFILSKPCPVLLSSVNPHIICNLCYGYLIDATTIVECLHSFCHSCLIKHLRTEQYCPRCEMMINTAKPNIKSDTTLQAIVYKLVPGLYEKELMRKRAFYKNRPHEAALATPEQRGDDTEHLIFSPSDYMSLSLEYADIDEHLVQNSEYNELIKPRYLQCPAMYTVALLKRFVHGKFEIDTKRFYIDIMYKVKTIVLLDHYTLMDVAYIYTWKRDAPMRFYFRVKEYFKPIVKPKKTRQTVTKTQIPAVTLSRSTSECTTIAPEATPPNVNESLLIKPSDIKTEKDDELAPSPRSKHEPKYFEIVPQKDSTDMLSSVGNQSEGENLKITLVSKPSTSKAQQNVDSKFQTPSKPSKEKRHLAHLTPANEYKEERKVENIKLKIDLSKQNSVTIINMSDPERKEIVKPVKPDKEWKVKNKREKEKETSPKSSPSTDTKIRVPSPLTVPPLTIKTERISPLAKSNSTSPSGTCVKETSCVLSTGSEDEQKSQFLKSFALAPVKTIKSPEKAFSRSLSFSNDNLKTLIDLPKEPLKTQMFKNSAPSKRKNKEPTKAIRKKPKLSASLPEIDFKVKLPPTSNIILKPPSPPPVEKVLMPPPAPLSIMRPPNAPPKKSQKLQNKPSGPASLTSPHLLDFQMAPPGNRTPIAKRYHPILPKAARPNPFANIPSEVNKILKEAGTEIKSIGKSTNISKVYGPKTESTLMGPPPPPPPNQPKSTITQSAYGHINPLSSKSGHGSKTNSGNNYLNIALFNSSKSKGNEAPPGCRTPIYSPNSPIYSPSSPQYVPNYNIPTIPSYKYTPKPSNACSSYLQNILGVNSQLSSLFPAPPVKQDNQASHSSISTPKNSSQSKRGYPFSRSPSPVEEPPEKELKVKSLLTSCNINIPSSLSITITREDGESQSSSASYPKHKSPVNNYIEILKLPDQTSETTDNKRQTPSTQNPSATLTNVKTSESTDNKRQTPSTQKPSATSSHVQTSENTDNKRQTPSTQKPSATLSHVHKEKSDLKKIPPDSKIDSQSSGKDSHKNPVQTKENSSNKISDNRNVTIPVSKPSSPLNWNVTGSTLDNLGTSLSQQTTKDHNHIISKHGEKKSPSPEKLQPYDAGSGSGTSCGTSSPNSDSKFAKLPTASPDAMAVQSSKKFRHILPRQNPTPILEVIPPKVTTASVIGTYSSPSGVAVKVHVNKKVPPAKKSPSLQQKQTKMQPHIHGAMSHNTAKLAFSTAAPSSIDTTKSTISMPTPILAASNDIHNALPHVGMPSLPNPIHALSNIPNLSAHLGVGAAASAVTSVAGQADFNKFLKDNYFRVQAAAAASQSSMFYSYAAAAAQMGNPSMYNYQRAYIMEQLSRRQRVDAETFTEYFHKLKNGLDKLPRDASITHPKPPSKQTVTSAKTSPTTPPPLPPPPTPLPVSAASAVAKNSEKTTPK